MGGGCSLITDKDLKRKWLRCLFFFVFFKYIYIYIFVALIVTKEVATKNVQSSHEARQ